ncbi:MAG: class I SAM-dependent methyltransferase [Bifidobacteriaceae bacterium]|nr:class I SAM-dependent methyltransferase [Bifidobacteriaceae bacterium]
MRADLTKSPPTVTAMFDQVAECYDKVNRILSVGLDSYWRRATVKAIDPLPGERVLDLAGGTGTSAIALAELGANVVCADRSAGMLAVAAKRAVPAALVLADATDLPFVDETFDVVTVSFGLRNLADPLAGLREMWRVTKPGGRLVICEFSPPGNDCLGWAHRLYLQLGLPLLARLATGSAAAYQYLAESIIAWPDQRAVADLISQAGWRRVSYRDLSTGVVALHRAWRGAAD